MKQLDMNALYHMHYKYLLSFANKHVQDFYLAEDLVQDTFLLFWKQKNSMTKMESLSQEPQKQISQHTLTRSYLLYILNHLLEWKKKDTNRPTISIEDNPTHTLSYFPLMEPCNSTGVQDYEQKLVQFCFSLLSSSDQQVLYWYFYDNKNAKEISQLLSITHVAARKRLERGKKRLRNIYLSYI